jgi:hypothetical protein
VPSVRPAPAWYIVDARGNLLMLRCVVSLSILNALSVLTIHKLFVGTKMLKMFNLGRSVLLMFNF